MSKIHDLDFDDYLVQCVQLNPEDLQNEFCRTGADLAYFGARFAEALKTWRLAEGSRKRMWAKLYMYYRSELTEQDKGRVTEKQIESAVEVDAQYEKARLVEVTAEAYHLSAKTEFIAVQAKKDLLQSLGAQVRAEMSADPTIRDNRAAQRQFDPSPDELDLD